jgi:16S rRNA U516 pseudouridylate synthase RsuA-like enzyme
MISMAVVNRVQTACLFSRCSPRLASGALQFFSTDSPSSSRSTTSKTVSLSKILSQNTSLSRRELERLIGRGEVTLRGQVVNTSLISISDWKDINKSDVKIKVQGKPVLIDSKKSESESTPRVWAVHKLPGEVVGEKDPQDRPSMIDRISRGGVGKEHRDHLKPIGYVSCNSRIC